MILKYKIATVIMIVSAIVVIISASIGLYSGFFMNIETLENALITEFIAAIFFLISTIQHFKYK